METEAERWRADVAEEYLEPIRTAGRRLRARQAELREERERAGGLTGIDYTRPFVATSARRDALPDALLRLADLEDAYRADLDALGEMRDAARACLDAMGGRGADLLRLRYVSALPWVTVAEGMGLAEGTCRNMKRAALARFYDFLPHSQRPPMRGALPERI